MRALSMHDRNWCIRWAYESGTDACTEHTRQVLMRAQSAFPSKNAEHTHQGLMRTLSEHTGQELMCSLSIRVRNWCVPWAYASVSYAYAQHKYNNSKFEKVPSKHAEHAIKELMRTLSVCVRNWCVHWAYASGTDAQAQRAHQKLNDA